jgi:hypothetical protein
MNFNAEELTTGATELLEKLSDGISVEDVFSSLKLPQLDQFSQLASSLLPQNLVSVNSEGFFSLLNPLELQNTVKAGIDSLQDVIKQEINDVISEVTSIAQQGAETINNVGNTLQSLGKKLTTDQLGFFEEAFSTATSMFDLGIDVGVVSNFANSVGTATNAIRELSPKQIRDLADPEYLQKVVSTTLETANSLLETEVISTAAEYASLPVSTGAVNSLFSTVNTLLGGVGPKATGEPYSLQVRVSTYYGKGDSGDIDAFNKKSATKQQLTSGKSAAVDNVKILYGSKIEVPGLGTFNAVDKIRSGGVDLQLYYEDANKAAEADAKLKSSMVVKVTPPGGGVKTDVQLPGRRGDSAKLV